jgi:hypothetical protein
VEESDMRDLDALMDRLSTLKTALEKLETNAGILRLVGGEPNDQAHVLRSALKAEIAQIERKIDAELDARY